MAKERGDEQNGGEMESEFAASSSFSSQAPIPEQAELWDGVIEKPQPEANKAEEINMVEEQEFFEAEGIEEFDSLPEAMGGMSLQKDPVKAKEMKEKGNKLYQAKDFEGALECYSLAIQYCPYQLKEDDPAALRRRRRLVDDEDGEEGREPQQAAAAGDGGGAAAAQKATTQKDEAGGVKEAEEEPFAEYKEELAVYYGNRAACLVTMGKDKEAVDDCTKALKLKPGYIKAVLRRAQASERLDKLEDALRDYKQVVELDPSCRQAREKIPGLERVCAERMEKLKNETLGKLKELGNSVLSNFGLSLDNFKMQQDPNSGSYSISFNK